MILSKPSSNVEGLTETQIRQKALRETPPGNYYRARRKKELSLTEQEEIINKYLATNMTQKEVAGHYRVTEQLVRDLVTEYKKRPDSFKERKTKVKE